VSKKEVHPMLIPSILQRSSPQLKQLIVWTAKCSSLKNLSVNYYVSFKQVKYSYIWGWMALLSLEDFSSLNTELVIILHLVILWTLPGDLVKYSSSNKHNAQYLFCSGKGREAPSSLILKSTSINIASYLHISQSLIVFWTHDESTSHHNFWIGTVSDH
jgi:hypothetical protein